MKEIFEPSINCQKVLNAQRAAFIIDGEAYFRALYESFRHAHHTIFIIGWDIHSDLELVRGDVDSDYPVELGAFLNRLVADRRGLRVYLLSWDFAMIYSLEREFFPRYKLKWRTHKRIHFCLDGNHPIGASQHQKIVVVDDSVAFVGGFDLSKWRWDTPAHQPDDSRRIDPAGKPYPPFHDIQTVVDGSAARALGQLARERWIRAGGRKHLLSETAESEAPWPTSIEPEFKDVGIAIARTLPAYEGRPAVREVEKLYLDCIAEARRFIYIENQYLSSHRICQALEERLGEPDGPEVVVVLPQKTGGWLEQHTMDVLRGRILCNLREADRHDRLRTYCPRITKNPLCTLMVHAKVMVTDDDIARVGSSNLSNRSMGFDSECDLAIATGGDDRLRSKIAQFRNRLLAEHLGKTIGQVAGAVEKTGSLIKAIESMRGGDRTLVELSGDVPPELDMWVPDAKLLDPEKPVDPDELFDHFVMPADQPSAYRHLLKVFMLIVGIASLTALWRWTPVGEWVDMESARTAGEWIRRQPLTPALVPLAYILGGVVAFPITLMVVATVLVFGPWWGVLYALTGSELSAITVFATGRVLGRDAVRRFAGSMVNRLSQKLSASGLTAVIAFRIVPVAPFSVINLIAGVSEIRFRDFALGTFIGMLPGVIAIIFLADHISKTLRQPDLSHFITLGIGVALVGAGLVGIRFWVKRKRDKRSAQNKN